MVRKAINDPSLESHLAVLAPDGVTWFSLGPEGSPIQMRGVLIHGSRMVCQMRANHALSSVETLLLGKGCLCAGLAASLLKDAGSIMLRIDASGPAEGLSAEGMRSERGEISVRGRLFKVPLSEQALTLDSAAKLFGPGALTVTRTEGRSKPFTGSVPLRTGNINKDLTRYFLESEQTRTAIDSGIHFTPDGKPDGAGALLLQALPGAEEKFLAGVESSLAGLPPLGLWFAQGGTRDHLIRSIFGAFGAARTAESDFVFGCPCSRQRFLSHLVSLDSSTIADILENGPWPLETVCHYCSSVYSFSRDEFVRAARQSSK